MITSEGKRKTYRIRRLKCKGCGKLHNELPSCMTPNKHYETKVIEGELDSSRKDCPADNRTINSWRKAFRKMRTVIEGILKAKWSYENEKHYPLLDKDSLLEEMINTGPGWLTIVNKLLNGINLRLHTQFVF